MSNKTKLVAVRLVHTAIYLVMASAITFILYSGLRRRGGKWLRGALALVSIESLIFFGNGMKCPLTGLAQRYGADRGYAFDTLLPEAVAKHTFRFFGSMLAVGLVMLLRNGRHGWTGVPANSKGAQ